MSSYTPVPIPHLTAQEQLDAAIDSVLDVLFTAEGQELDPLATIIARMKARGQELDLSEMPPLMAMLLGGMTG
jgi:hypothetical protein